MLANLKAELARHDFTVKDVERAIGKTERTARSKVDGLSAFTFPEALALRNTLFPGMSLEYLFAADQQPTTER